MTHKKTLTNYTLIILLITQFIDMFTSPQQHLALWLYQSGKALQRKNNLIWELRAEERGNQPSNINHVSKGRNEAGPSWNSEKNNIIGTIGILWSLVKIMLNKLK